MNGLLHGQCDILSAYIKGIEFGREGGPLYGQGLLFLQLGLHLVPAQVMGSIQTLVTT